MVGSIFCQCGHSAELHGDGQGCAYAVWDDGQWLEESCDCPAFQAVARLEDIVNDVQQMHQGGNGHAPQRLSPPEPVVNHGRLSVSVWPVYLGLATAQGDTMIREPTEHHDYERGRIKWFDTVNGVGRARVSAPKGVYTHIIFCMGPRENVVGVDKMDHPIFFDRAGFIDVDPINVAP